MDRRGTPLYAHAATGTAIRRRTIAVALIFGGAASACGPYLQGSGGYASSPTDPNGQRGGALNLHAGIGIVGGDDVVLAHGPNIRARVTERLGQVSLGNDFTLRYILETDDEVPSSSDAFITPMELYVRAGWGVVGIGAFDGGFSFAGASPFLEYGLVLMQGHEDVPYVTLGAAIERDLRWTSQQSTTSVSFLLGIGFLKIRRSDSALMRW